MHSHVFVIAGISLRREVAMTNVPSSIRRFRFFFSVVAENRAPLSLSLSLVTKCRYTPHVYMCVYIHEVHNIYHSLLKHSWCTVSLSPLSLSLSLSLYSRPREWRNANEELLCSAMRDRRCTFVTSGLVFDNLAWTWFTRMYAASSCVCIVYTRVNEGERSVYDVCVCTYL